MREDHPSTESVNPDPNPDPLAAPEFDAALVNTLGDLPIAKPSRALDARMEDLLSASSTHPSLSPSSPRFPFRFPSFSRVPTARLGMAAALLMALGLGVLIGRGTSPVVEGQQAANETSGRLSGQPAVQRMNETPAPSIFEWQHQPESDLVLVESAPVSPVMTVDDGQPARAWGTQGLRREVYVDKARDAQLELIQPEQRVIWVSQPVY